MSVAMTRAPSAAKASAVARPMPCAAAVTKAVLPASLAVIVSVPGWGVSGARKWARARAGVNRRRVALASPYGTTLERAGHRCRQRHRRRDLPDAGAAGCRDPGAYARQPRGCATAVAQAVRDAGGAAAVALGDLADPAGAASLVAARRWRRSVVWTRWWRMRASPTARRWRNWPMRQWRARSEAIQGGFSAWRAPPFRICSRAGMRASSRSAASSPTASASACRASRPRPPPRQGWRRWSAPWRWNWDRRASR